MEEWINEWHKRYQTLKAATEAKEVNEHLFTELANECEQVLEAWMEMEDKLEDIKELKEEQTTTKTECSKDCFKKTEGITYFDLDMFSKAIDVLNKELLEIDGKFEAMHYLYIGYANLYEGNIDQSKQSFLYVIHSTECNIEKHFAYFGLGCLYGRIRHYEEAISFFEKADELFSNPDVFYNIGVAFVSLNKYNLAIEHFKKSIQFNSEDGESYYYLGLCYLKSGNENRAFESWYAALQLTEYKDLLVSIAYELEKIGYYSAAINCYKRLQSLGHHEAWVDHGIAWNRGLLDEKEKAIHLFETLLGKDPDDPNIWISFLWLLKKWNEWELYECWLSKAPKNIKMHRLIKSLIQQSMVQV